MNWRTGPFKRGGGGSSPATDPWISLDGRLGAPAATIQHPHLLDTYHPGGPVDGRYRWPTTAALNYQPQWEVAGVDYAVGYPAATSFTDWYTYGTAGHTGVSVSGQVLRLDTGFVGPLDSIDFSTSSSHGSAELSITNLANVVVSNCKFGAVVSSSGIINTDVNSSGLTVIYCVVDAGTPNNQTSSVVNCNGGGTIIITYNWFKNAEGSFVDIVNVHGGAVTYKYNLVERGSTWPPLHLNTLEFNTGQANSADIEFNAVYQEPGAAGGEFFQVYDGSGGTLGNSTIAYNTMIANISSTIATVHATSTAYAIGAIVTVAGGGAPYYAFSPPLRNNSTTYGVGDAIIVPSATVSDWFTCTAGGISSGSTPAGYGTCAVGATVTDGGATFQGKAASDTVSSASSAPSFSGAGPDQRVADGSVAWLGRKYAVSYMLHGTSADFPTTLTGTTYPIHDNFVDLTGAQGNGSGGEAGKGMFYPSSFTGWTVSNNYAMPTGNAVNYP